MTILRMQVRTVVVGFILLLGLCLVAAQARGDDPPVPIVAGAGLDWGIKESFRNYIEGHIAAGAITVSGGATRNPDGSFHFPLREGSFDSRTNATVVQFDGTVRMEGHHGALDMTVADPRVELAPNQARLITDVASRPVAGGEPVLEPSVLFATLTLTGVEPVVNGGTTTWSAVPTALGAGAVSAFAGHYAVGTPLDPLSFAYDGPGGKPLAPVESWSIPGVPVFGIVASTTLTGMGVGGLEPDPANDVIHAIGRATSKTSYRALNPVTLETIDALDDPMTSWSANAQQTTAQRTLLAGGTLFVASTAGPVQRTRFHDGAYVQDGTIGSATLSAPTNVRAAPDLSRLYLFGGPATEPWARTLDVSDGNWTVRDHTLDGSLGLTDNFVVDPAGVVLEVHRGGTPDPRPIGIYDFGVSPLQRTDIAGSLLGDSPGFGTLALAPGGVLWAAEEAPLSRVQKFVKGPAGYAPAGDPIETGAMVKEIAVDPNDGTLWVSTQSGGSTHPVLAIRHGEIVASVPLPAFANKLAVDEGTLYASSQTGGVWAIRALGETPAITDPPDDASVVLDAGETSTEAFFTAAASGDPAPSVRWQSRAPGNALFENVPGGTGEILAVEVGVAEDGTEYRAVFANDVGEVASDAATLTVKAVPSFAVSPTDTATSEGEDALLKLLPSGHPMPEVQWQRLDSGAWTDLAGATDLFLSIPDTTSAMSGTRYRAVLSNEVGSATSGAVTLTVVPPLPLLATFGSGHLDWGVKESFRKYIEGPIAHGSYGVAEGATRNPDGSIRFELYGGNYETETRTGEMQFFGAVRFTGHAVLGEPQLDLTIRNPRLVLAGDDATLYANATSKAIDSGAVQQFPEVALANVDLTGIAPTPLVDGLGFEALSTALTAAGVPVFAQYAAATAMDPLVVVARYGTSRSLPRADSPADIDPPVSPGSRPNANPPALPAIAHARRAQIAGRKATIAVVTCRRGPCRIVVPRQVLVSSGNRRLRATVLAPRALAGGRRALVRVRFKRRTLKQLGCGHGTVRLPIAVVEADGRAGEVVTVTLQQRAERCGVG